jgi:hypothetical protein
MSASIQCGMYECCRDYASADFIPAHDEGKFDYVAVDGRSRMLCLKRALKLIKPEVPLPIMFSLSCAVFVEHGRIVHAVCCTACNTQSSRLSIRYDIRREESCCWTTQVHPFTPSRGVV